MSMLTIANLVKYKKLQTSTPWLGEIDDAITSTFIKAAETLDQGLEDDDLFTKSIWCVPLNLKHGSGSKVHWFGNTSSKILGSGNSSVPKRQKIEALAKYDRLVEFADLSDRGNCFVMIFKEQSKAKQMLKYCADISALGTPMLLGNPLKSVTTMARSGLPLVEAEFPLVPLTVEGAGYDIKEMLPPVAIKVPEEPGQLKYFILHEKEIVITRFQYITEGVSCTGLMCDRARELIDKNVACGCTHTGFDSRGTVAKATVKIPVPTTVNGTENAEVRDYRSQRFTDLVVADNKALQKKDSAYLATKYIKHNKTVKEMVEYVNDHGGWSIVGWFRRGESADSSTEGATAESFATTLHISLLVPTNGDIRNLRDVEFKKMRIKIEDVTSGAASI